MKFPRLTFPLTVDFSDAEYWIGEYGPFKLGEAVTAFFIGEDIAAVANDGIPLMQELEVYLAVFGSQLHPYVRAETIPNEMYIQLNQSSAGCTVSYAFRPVQKTVVQVERYTFSSLHDFLYVELGKAILRGNAPRQCRLCGRWFLHEQGDRAMYCERIAPREEIKTCREAGARAVFEKKIQEEDVWKLYKRAYKKYYARVMKGNMTRNDFNAWAKFAAAQRDTTRLKLEGTSEPGEQAKLINKLQEELNRK